VEDRVASGDFGTPSEFIRYLIRQNKEQQRSRLESELLGALQTREIAISPEEMSGRSLVSLLREKLGHPRWNSAVCQVQTM
jgi:antitoxin ParD1/3/4